jgi:hypothetical protein
MCSEVSRFESFRVEFRNAKKRVSGFWMCDAAEFQV